MKRESRELVRGSGNVFADFGMPNAAVEQLKALLAAKIIKVLDAKKLSVRMAEEQTRIAAADFSRIRRVKLDRFTIDRLMKIWNASTSELRCGSRLRRRRIPNWLSPEAAKRQPDARACSSTWRG